MGFFHFLCCISLLFQPKGIDTVYCQHLKIATVIWTWLVLLEMDDGSTQFSHRQSPELENEPRHVSQLYFQLYGVVLSKVRPMI